MLTEQIIQCLFGVGEQHRVKIQSVAQVYAKRKATKKESYTANFCNYFFFVSLFLPLSLSPSLPPSVGLNYNRQTQEIQSLFEKRVQKAWLLESQNS